MSFIYDDILEEYKEKCGYFETKLPFSLIQENSHYLETFGKDIHISENTLIFYYPGAFTVFHSGHMKVIKSVYEYAKSITDDFYIVLSPSNTDYLVQKYSKKHEIHNQKRYDRIYKSILNDSYHLLKHIVIDLNPMMNTKVDYNFTDLLKSFIEHYLPYDKLQFIPYIVCGKDRDFRKLEKHTDKLKVFYFEGDDTSSKNMIKMNTNKKKICLLRCFNEKELKLFRKYFDKFYSMIIPSYNDNEIEKVKEYVRMLEEDGKSYITICKDYKNILPYYKFSREWVHPLRSDKFINAFTLPEVDIVIDSDVYGGKTRQFIETYYKSKLLAINDVYGLTNDIEIVDITDLYDDLYRYPQYDISERMSLPPFDLEMHDLFDNFKKELKNASD